MPTKTAQPPMLERGDTVYARHPRHGAVVVRVVAAGKDGYTAEDGTGKRHKLLHETYLGHKARVIPLLKMVDQGADGALVEDSRGMRRFIKGELPQLPEPAEPSGGKKATGRPDDPLIGGLNLLKKALVPMGPLALPDGMVLMLKAAPGHSGLALRQITDSQGRRSRRWVKASPDQKKGRRKKKPDETTDTTTPHPEDKPVGPALHRHGDLVAFRHGDVEGVGVIVGSGADGVTVADEAGREHLVRHEYLLPQHPPRPAPKSDKPPDKKPLHPKGQPVTVGAKQQTDQDTPE